MLITFIFPGGWARRHWTFCGARGLIEFLRFDFYVASRTITVLPIVDVPAEESDLALHNPPPVKAGLLPKKVSWQAQTSRPWSFPESVVPDTTRSTTATTASDPTASL
jgi:hypothetical protein